MKTTTGCARISSGCSPGNRVAVNVSNGKNDLQFFKSKSEVITALIHLGYFAYDADAREAYVPNKEIQEVFLSVYGEQ